MSINFVFKRVPALSAGMAAISQLLLTACTEQEITRSTDIQQVSNETRVAKKPDVIEIEGQKYIRDEVDGTLYDANPNRKPVPMGNMNADILGKEAAARYGAWDQSQKVEMRMWECKSSSRKEHQTVSCEVDADFVVVGGGARTVYYGKGALLTEARPFDPGLYSYVGSSKSHFASDPHDLYVYVVGLRLVGLLRNDLWLNTQFVTKTSGIGESPSENVGLSVNHALIGGGAKVNWSGNGNLLTNSYPFNNKWYGAGKSHSASSPASITVYAIGIMKMSISSWGSLKFGETYFTSSSGNGVLTKSNQILSGFVLTCPGVRSEYSSGPGRMLYGIYPNPEFHGGVWGASKDHLSASYGRLDVFSIQVQKAP